MLSESGSYLRLNLASVPREDKEAVVDLVRVLVALSVKARHEGLLSLGEDVDARGGTRVVRYRFCFSRLGS